MNDGLNKYHCLERAKALLSKGRTVDLRYAALEIRMCMEMMTYEKLRAAGKHIPEHVINAWQPPQAVKALLEFEPLGDSGFKLYAGIEETPGVPAKEMQFIGEHKPLKLKWLRKHYHKVGKFLHGEHSSDAGKQMPDEELRRYLLEVVSDVEEAASGNIHGAAFIEPFHVECKKCHQVFVVAKHTLEHTNRVVCFSPNCKAEYHGQLEYDKSATFQLMVTNFECGKCKTPIPIENRLLAVGLEFTCEKCKTNHRIESRNWGYTADFGEAES